MTQARKLKGRLESLTTRPCHRLAYQAQTWGRRTSSSRALQPPPAPLIHEDKDRRQGGGTEDEDALEGQHWPIPPPSPSGTKGHHLTTWFLIKPLTAPGWTEEDNFHGEGGVSVFQKRESDGISREACELLRDPHPRSRSPHPDKSWLLLSQCRSLSGWSRSDENST